MIERDKLISSLNACRHEPGYDCKKDCVFYEIGSAECIERLMDAVHEYIGDFEDVWKERDRLAEELYEVKAAYETELEFESTVVQANVGLEEAACKLQAENHTLKVLYDSLLESFPKWKRVEDERPKYNTQVKLWTNEGFEYIGVYTYSKQFITDGFFDITHKVTHWMALDEAPETHGEEKENA